MICLALAARAGHAADQPLQKSLGPYLTAHFKTPEEYIRDTFKTHDLVIVGELHHVKQGLDLLHRLLPMLYRDCGVRFLGYEFYASSLQGEIDALVTAKEYDEALAMKILRESAARAGILWAHEEYVDVFKVVWRLNQTVGQPSERLRIIFMMPDTNWRAFHNGTQLERARVALQVAASDKHYADQIIKEYDRTGRKGLIWCGSTHAVTRLKSPSPQSRPKRMGSYLYDRYGDKVFMIRLHEPASLQKGDLGYLLGGELDRALREFGKPVGFDIAGSPLAGVKIPQDCFWATDNPDATLSAYNDGYVWLAPLEEFQGNRLLNMDQVVPDEQTFRMIARNGASKAVQEMKTREEYRAVWNDYERRLRHFPEGFMPFLSGSKPKAKPPAGKEKETRPSAAK